MNELIGDYIAARDALAAARAEAFPHVSNVIVDCPQYHGPGIVVRSDGCPVDKLPVLLENGNVWWYPMEACSRVEGQACSKVAP